MKNITYNIATGERIVADLTTEEIAELQELATPTLQQQRNNRAAAYAAEADPLFFKAQRGEATTDEWTAKVAEIKARFPYPGADE